MATTKYSDLVTEVLPVLAADPSDPVTEHAIKRAAIEFIGKSWVWRDLPDAIDVTQGEAAYDLEPPQGADISMVVTAILDGTPLDPTTPEWLDQNVRDWRTEQDTPRYFAQVDTEQVILAKVPSSTVTAGLVLTVAVQPSVNSTGIPKWIASKYLDEITSGALARLLLMPGQPWTDMALGKDHEGKFKAGIANARADIVAGLNSAPTRTSSQH